MTDHLLAATVDHLAAANWMFACVNAAEDGDAPEAPEPVPRPDNKPYADQGADPGTEQDPESASASASAGTDAVSPDTLVRFFG
ncbi:hypothetical protein [Streptomyces sp. NPDC051546]|uniref:hypothetical protein n=1 Tax=Streptomyces sp. NPDC051546 TaxID=3365655 RepID=UPI00378D6169